MRWRLTGLLLEARRRELAGCCFWIAMATAEWFKKFANGKRSDLHPDRWHFDESTGDLVISDGFFEHRKRVLAPRPETAVEVMGPKFKKLKGTQFTLPILCRAIDPESTLITAILEDLGEIKPAGSKKKDGLR